MAEIRCNDTKWIWSPEIEPKIESTNVTCVPACPKPCANDGVCIWPGKCQCPVTYSGDYCEIHVCSEPPPSPPDHGFLEKNS